MMSVLANFGVVPVSLMLGQTLGTGIVPSIDDAIDSPASSSRARQVEIAFIAYDGQLEYILCAIRVK